MADQTVRQEQLQLLPAYQETYLKNLLASVGGQLDEEGNVIPGTGLVDTPVTIPEQEVAALTPAQLSAIQTGMSGVGSYLPMLQAGEATLGQGIGGYQSGMQYALSGVPLFQQAATGTESALAGATPYQQAASRALQSAAAGGQEQALAGQLAASSAAGALGGYGARGAAMTGQAAQNLLGQTGAAQQNILGQAGTAQQNILGTVAAAQPYQQAAMGRIGQAADIVGGSARAYDPQSYQQFMDPYTESVVRQAEQDIARQGEMCKRKAFVHKRLVRALLVGHAKQLHSAS